VTDSATFTTPENEDEDLGEDLGGLDDLRIKRALKVAPNIEFYRYEVKFDLIKS